MMDRVQESLGKVQEFLTSLRRDYVSWIVKNPSLASDTESAVKLLSYLLHGRFKHNSTILPELLYCSANLLAFCHDRIIQEHRKGGGGEKRRNNNVTKGPEENGGGSNGNRIIVVEDEGVGDVIQDSLTRSATLHAQQREAREKQIQRIRTTLTIIDYLEVFLEVSARQLWGEFGRWVVIIILQSVKTGLRAALLLYFKVGLIGSSTLYQRRYGRNSKVLQYQPNLTFVLKHSGRTVRKIHAAPPAMTREFTGAALIEDPTYGPHELPPLRKLAEVIHLARPMTHLACMGIWGSKSWTPWLISFAMDIASLRLHTETNTNLRRDEKLELTRRMYALSYYLMRSPFYDTCTKKRLLGTLIMFSRKIPLLGNICGMLADAIPEWQSTYSYMWTDY